MKYVYMFSEGNKTMKKILGGKGANLAEMTKIGLPVPRGFTVSTEACNLYYENKLKIGSDVKNQILQNIKQLEKKTKKEFGSTTNPLLVSVRSGARVSMPGMMDTILNLGLNDKVCEGFALKTNKRFVYDSYRRLIMMYSDVVKGCSKDYFEKYLEEYKEDKKVKYDSELNDEDMFLIANKFKKIYKKVVKEEFPQDPYIQLIEAVEAVFRSWNNERAIYYRKLNDIPSNWGTAVNIQEMVYGNMGNNSGTGVAFTRNPATGEKKIFGEYLINAQGEDVVAGVRTPQSIDTLKDIMPDVYDEFTKICKKLESHYKDMQDMEFTIEDGKLFMLQTRSGKRTGYAAVKIAVDLVNEKMITKEEALLRVEPKQLDQLLHLTFDSKELSKHKPITSGLAASPGAACGMLCFNASEVVKEAKNGNKTVLVRLETSPEDIEGMNVAEGILTVRGGMTSHAAVVARGMGKCCVSGCSDIKVDEKNKKLTTKDGKVLNYGDYISLDGTTGLVYEGKIKTVEPEISGNFEKFMSWADKYRKLKIRTNADTPNDAIQALKFGAEGIGLCRTEHMFFDEKRIFSMRQMIVATDDNTRKKALNKILPMQRSDFESLFRIMNGYPVVIRYLDPPLHEFLPKTDKEIKELAFSLKVPLNTLKNRIDELHEFNPMMGHRGCRLDITYPEIARMQTRAVMEAAINVSREGIKVKPEIMIPLIVDVKELKYIKDIVEETIEEIFEENKCKVKYKIGTMIETPRAALLADQIAKEAEFFSFGTNDLTQLTYGFSRDDSSKFLNDYYKNNIFESDPFARIDEDGVGELVKTATKKGRRTRNDIELGICGEHGGEEKSIDFCHRTSLNYVSCSPYRIPLARLSAAQAAIKAGTKKN